MAVREGIAVVRMMLMVVVMVMVVRHEMGIRKIRHGHRKVRDGDATKIGGTFKVWDDRQRPCWASASYIFRIIY